MLRITQGSGPSPSSPLKAMGFALPPAWYPKLANYQKSAEERNNGHLVFLEITKLLKPRVVVPDPAQLLGLHP